MNVSALGITRHASPLFATQVSRLSALGVGSGAVGGAAPPPVVPSAGLGASTYYAAAASKPKSSDLIDGVPNWALGVGAAALAGVAILILRRKKKAGR